MAKKEDLAKVVDFLCSEDSKYIIGENISFEYFMVKILIIPLEVDQKN